jgi:glycosyltransferase involved in cell wall biosynthesis
MKISVVIPAYNEEHLLPRTLDSLRKQDRTPDEVIVVDASSTDRTAEIAAQAGAQVITVPKQTIGYSRQQGVQQASGDVILQTDADALLPENWISRIEQSLKDRKYVGYFGGFRVKDGPLWYRIYINLIQPVTNALTFRLTGIPFATGQNMGFWKDVAIKAGGFPEDYKLAEDIEIARRIQKLGRIRFTMKEFVYASGRRGNERGLLLRIMKAFFLYFVFRKANKIGFPDIR